MNKEKNKLFEEEIREGFRQRYNFRVNFGTHWSVFRRGIIMTTRSANRFVALRPHLKSKLGVGFRGRESEWTVWWPPKKEWENEIIKSLTELKIPFKVEFGLRYVKP